MRTEAKLRRRPAGLEAQRVHELEDRRVGARAQSEREDRDERECGVLAQQARAEAQILP